MISRKDLSCQTEKLGVLLTNEQSEQIASFSNLLANFNQHTNLIANADPEVFLFDHVLDSLSLVPILENLPNNPKAGNGAKLIDIGSGAGLPGLLLAIARPSLQVVLVESLGKKVQFLKEAVSVLCLNDRVCVQHGRAELLAHDRQFRHQFDLATARAVGAVALVLEVTLPYLCPGGVALLQKSQRQCHEQARPAGCVARKLKAKLVDTVYLDPAIYRKERGIFIFEQLEPVPMPYPRSWQKITKAPIA
jgi:16S rRNA (guanine527-N7)-methyltransferase